MEFVLYLVLYLVNYLVDSRKYERTIMHAIGLAVTVLGLQMALKVKTFLLSY